MAKRSESRREINVDPEEAKRMVSVIRDDLPRSPSPSYEIWTSNIDRMSVSESMIYRRVETG